MFLSRNFATTKNTQENRILMCALGVFTSSVLLPVAAAVPPVPRRRPSGPRPLGRLPSPPPRLAPQPGRLKAPPSLSAPTRRVPAPAPAPAPGACGAAWGRPAPPAARLQHQTTSIRAGSRESARTDGQPLAPAPMQVLLGRRLPAPNTGSTTFQSLPSAALSPLGTHAAGAQSVTRQNTPPRG